MVLDPDGQHENYRLRFFFHIMVYTQATDPQFPGRQWVGAHGFAILRLSRWLVNELSVYAIQYNTTLPDTQGAQMILRIGRIQNAMRQGITYRG